MILSDEWTTLWVRFIAVAQRPHAPSCQYYRGAIFVRAFRLGAGIYPKTVAVDEMKNVPTEQRSTVLTEAKNAVIGIFRSHSVHDENLGQLRTRLTDVLTAYNFACGLKMLNGLAPYGYICEVGTAEPGPFILNQIHQMP